MFGFTTPPGQWNGYSGDFNLVIDYRPSKRDWQRSIFTRTILFIGVEFHTRQICAHSQKHRLYGKNQHQFLIFVATE